MHYNDSIHAHIVLPPEQDLIDPLCFFVFATPSPEAL